MLLWLDLETTRLEPTTNQVLEVAAIVTDDQLNEVARFERVIYCDLAFESLDPFVQDMHTKNGLWPLVKESQNTRYTVDFALSEFIRGHAQKLVAVKDAGKVTIDKPQLAGSTISFDRSFMAAHLPLSLSECHYRNLDVSTLNEVARRFWPEVYEGRPRTAKEDIAHRGMADIQASIAVARYYVETIGRKP